LGTLFVVLAGCGRQPAPAKPPMISGTVTMADGRNVNGVFIVFKLKSKRTFDGMVNDGKVDVEVAESGFADIYFKIPPDVPLPTKVDETPEEKQEREAKEQERKAKAAQVTRDIPAKYLDPANPALGISIEPKGDTPLYLKLTP
jgi:hypothetical protein